MPISKIWKYEIEKKKKKTRCAGPYRWWCLNICSCYLLIQGMVGTSAPNFARICPKLVSPSTTPTNTAPLDADMLTDSNRNCANKGSYVFLTTGSINISLDRACRWPSNYINGTICVGIYVIFAWDNNMCFFYCSLHCQMLNSEFFVTFAIRM